MWLNITIWDSYQLCIHSSGFARQLLTVKLNYFPRELHIRHWSVAEHNVALSVWPDPDYCLRYFLFNFTASDNIYSPNMDAVTPRILWIYYHAEYRLPTANSHDLDNIII